MKKSISWLLLGILLLQFSFVSADLITTGQSLGEEASMGATPINIAFTQFSVINTTTPETPETPTTPETPGSGTTTTPQNIETNPSELDISFALGDKIEKTISVTNVGTTSTTIIVSQSNLDGMVVLRETSLTLAPQETKTFNVAFIDKNETGIFTGYIHVGSANIPISLNIKTKLLLFDSNIVVTNLDYEVKRGKELKTKVTLIPLGDEERMDVTLNYVIKDYDGKIYLSQSETLLIEKKMSFKKNFDTGKLPLGNYIVGLELIYSGGVAPSSAHFEIVKTQLAFEPADFLLYGLILFLVMAIIIIAIIIIRLSKKHRNQTLKN